MICIPIVARTQDAMTAEMAEAAKVADLVELRLDFAPGADVQKLIENRPCPVIVTHRPRREGGSFEGPEDERVAVLQQAVDLGAEYVDIEFSALDRIKRAGKTRFIVSYHNFDETPGDIERIHAAIVKAGADIAKVACMATDIRDNLSMFNLLRRTKHPTIALCMGEPGLISRVLGRKFRAFLTFAALAAGRESAPGQLCAGDLLGLYRYKSIGPDTAVYGVIANPVAHSMSPAILNAAFEANGVNAVYLPFKVEGSPEEFIRAFRALNVQGYSVTIPHKRAIIPAMDTLDDLVTKVGALNTVVNRDGKLFGTNTDVPAALRALENALPTDLSQRTEQKSPLAGRRVLLLGAGGAARALAFGLCARNANVTLANRTHERGEKLAQEVGCDCCRLDDISSRNAEILINTTSVGMHPNADATPAPKEALRPGMVVFDAVYNPPETRLLREAGEIGCKTVTGIAWFIHQAAAQFEIWTGQLAPRDIMERVLRERLAVTA